MTRVLRLIISFSLVLLYWTAVGVVAQFPFCVIYLQDYSLADWVLGHFRKADGEWPNYLMPIPANEMTKANGTLVQNPGY